jgi:hypothetical protein
MKPTKKILDDDRPVSNWAKVTFWTKLAHFLDGCWTLESMNHASTEECLLCRQNRYDENGKPINRRFKWLKS